MYMRNIREISLKMSWMSLGQISLFSEPSTTFPGRLPVEECMSWAYI